MDPITFRASLPQIQSAIKIGGDGLRFQLDVPESDKAAAIALAALTGCELRVTIELAEGHHDDEPDPGAPGPPRRRSAKRRERPGDPGV